MLLTFFLKKLEFLLSVILTSYLRSRLCRKLLECDMKQLDSWLITRRRPYQDAAALGGASLRWWSRYDYDSLRRHHDILRALRHQPESCERPGGWKGACWCPPRARRPGRSWRSSLISASYPAPPPSAAPRRAELRRTCRAVGGPPLSPLGPVGPLGRRDSYRGPALKHCMTRDEAL